MSADADTASSSNPLAAAASMTGCGGNGGATLRRRSTNSPSALASAWAVACSDRCASRSRWRRSSSSERRRAPSDVSAAFAARSRANSSASPSISTRVRAAASWAATRRRSSRRNGGHVVDDLLRHEIGNRLLPSFGTDQPQDADLVHQLRRGNRRQPFAKVLIAVDRRTNLRESGRRQLVESKEAFQLGRKRKWWPQLGARSRDSNGEFKSRSQRLIWHVSRFGAHQAHCTQRCRSNTRS